MEIVVFAVCIYRIHVLDCAGMFISLYTQLLWYINKIKGLEMQIPVLKWSLKKTRFMYL